MMKVKKIFWYYSSLKMYLHNTFWIMLEKVITIGLVFFVTVVVARFLGPEDFGLLAYALSLTGLFAAAGHMGLSGLVVREIIKKPVQRAEILGTSFVLKLLGMIAGYLALLLYAIVYEDIGSLEFYLVAITGAVLLFKPFDVIDFWFQAFIQARYIAIARVSSLLVTSALKLGLVFAGSGVVFFATASLMQAVLAAIVLTLLYMLKAVVKIDEWTFNKVRAKELLSQGWVIYLGSIFAVVYMKIDQVMLRWLVGVEEVGTYAVAAQLSESWYFVPTAIVASFFPKLIKLREMDEKLFDKRFQQLFDILFIIALGVAIVMTFISDFIVGTFFGTQYAESASILVIHIWAALFVFLRAAFSKWILIEDMLVFSLVTQGMGAFTNVLLNYFLIPEYGGQGAAFATLCSYSVASFFSLLIYRKTRKVFWQMVRSFYSPVRYAYSLSRIRLSR